MKTAKSRHKKVLSAAKAPLALMVILFAKSVQSGQRGPYKTERTDVSLYFNMKVGRSMIGNLEGICQ